MKDSMKAINKKGKTISEFFGVSEPQFRHVAAKLAAALTSSLINPFDHRTKGDVAVSGMKDFAKDKEAFEVKDLNTAFVYGMAFSLAIRMKEGLLEELEKKMGDVIKVSHPEDMVPRMAEQDFADISKHIGAVGEQVKKLERQKVVN